MDNERKLWIGTSGLVLPVPNKAAFPPEYRQQPRLAYYSSLFNSIEINSSFYKTPMPATFAKWADIVPDDFRITLKLGRHITHTRSLGFKAGEVDAFMMAASALGSKKGCLLVQLPPGLQATKGHAGRLTELLSSIAAYSWPIAVEFRHSSWYSPATTDLLAKWGASLVLQDMPASSMAEFEGNASFVYLRFHGQAGDYRGSYTAGYLSGMAVRIGAWLAAGKSVYAYFNNTIGDAVSNARDLGRLLQGF